MLCAHALQLVRVDPEGLQDGRRDLAGFHLRVQPSLQANRRLANRSTTIVYTCARNATSWRLFHPPEIFLRHAI